MKLSIYLLVIGLVVLFSNPLPSQAQAYCALRDPNRIIQGLFPEASGYRSFIRRVTRTAAAEISENSAVEFDVREFGKHTLYAVMEQDQLMGFVQSRTEVAKYGLAEIVWALDPELRLSRFQFQRCRSRWKNRVESDKIQSILEGLSEAELLKVLKEKGAKGLVVEAGLPASSEQLMELVMLSAIKTLGLSRVVWGWDIERFKKTK